MTKEFVARAHRHGYAVHVWFSGSAPDDAATYNAMIDTCADGLMPAKPTLLEQILDERSIERPSRVSTPAPRLRALRRRLGAAAADRHAGSLFGHRTHTAGGTACGGVWLCGGMAASHTKKPALSTTTSTTSKTVAANRGGPKLDRKTREELLEAHVAFELDRWHGEAFAAGVREEVAALQAWLGEVTVGDLLPGADTAHTLATALADVDLTAAAADLATDVLRVIRAALAASEATVGDVAAARDLHGIVDLVTHLDELRGTVIGAVTDSPAYHELVAHVLYHGVKAFVLNENIVARKLPGAQSLIRMGQRGLATAAPGLESGVDRQLRRFVQNQIGDTLIDSKRFLDRTLSGESGHELLDTTLSTVGPKRLAEFACLITDDDIEAVGDAAAPVARGILRSGVVAQATAAAVEQVLAAYADQPVAPLLADLGLGLDELADRFVDLVAPALEHAHASGYTEARIRARLSAFYLA
ncbi:hypothetical protein [Nostocoides australiense]